MYIVLNTETNLPHQNYISKIHLPMLVMELREKQYFLCGNANPWCAKNATLGCICIFISKIIPLLTIYVHYTDVEELIWYLYGGESHQHGKLSRV
jgi:hypothetical protein